VAGSHSNTALLLCGNNFLLNLCEAVRSGLHRASRSFFLASRAAIAPDQLSPVRSADDPRHWIMQSLHRPDIRLVLILQLFHLCRVALTAGRVRVHRTKRERATFRIESLLKSLWNSVVRVRRKKQVLREIDFHAMSFTNRDRGWYLDETVQDGRCGLRNAARAPLVKA